MSYPYYSDEYNRLVAFTVAVDASASPRFPLIVLGDQRNPADVIEPLWAAHAERAAIKLSSLASYLRSKLGKSQQEYEQIIDLIRDNLRPAIYDDPKREREVLNALETIFNDQGMDFRREQETVPYSTKRYIPDFTFDRLKLAVEVKLCKGNREKAMIDEINADIIGYGGRYDRCIFVVYDLGVIRDVARFSEDIEKNPGAHVLTIKR